MTNPMYLQSYPVILEQAIVKITQTAFKKQPHFMLSSVSCFHALDQAGLKLHTMKVDIMLVVRLVL